jgi:hypothetical protein
VGEVAGVENQVRPADGGVDLADSDLQGTVYVGICRLVEADVAVADLDESEVRRIFLWSAEQTRSGYATAKRPDHGCASPLHAP